jgi:hypothetical protein
MKLKHLTCNHDTQQADKISEKDDRIGLREDNTTLEVFAKQQNLIYNYESNRRNESIAAIFSTYYCATNTNIYTTTLIYSQQYRNKGWQQ